MTERRKITDEADARRCVAAARRCSKPAVGGMLLGRMRRADVYALFDHFYVIASSKTVAGFWIAQGDVVVIPAESDPGAIGRAVLGAWTTHGMVWKRPLDASRQRGFSLEALDVRHGEHSQSWLEWLRWHRWQPAMKCS